MNIIIGITGHANIEKALDYPLLKHGNIYNKEVYEKCFNDINDFLLKYALKNNISLNNITLVSGMARGIDEIFADIAISNNLKLILSIPNSISWHSTRGSSRGVRAQAIHYIDILKYDKIIKVNEVRKYYNGKEYKYANFARNQNIIDESNIVFSYKKYESSGTNDAIKSAIDAHKYGGNIPNLI